MEEFEEFDVLFSENSHHEKSWKKKKSGLDSMKVYPETQSPVTKEEVEEESRRKKKKMSAPIRIPLTTSGNSILNRMDQSVDVDVDVDDDGIFEEETGEELIFVAPHLMVKQRRMTSKRMAFSVCTGNGRTLKGRDLSRVRNCVLRMTGFIETC